MPVLRTETARASAAAVHRVSHALAAALGGGPPFLPLPPEPARAAALVAAARVDAPFHDAAVLIATSGSTGTPKLVTLSPDALRSSVTGTEVALGGPGQWLLALPMTHIAGLQVVVRSLRSGWDPIVHHAPHFSAESFADATSRLTGPRRYTALVPTQLRRLLSARVGIAALSAYDGVLIGGAATAPSLLAAAQHAGATVRTTYGMSETSGGCLYDGRPIGGARFDLDPSGRIRLGGPMLASGYRGEPGLTADAFTDGWFRTADAGRIGPDGELQVLGRLDDVVVTGGAKVHPLAVEAVIARRPGIRDVCVAGVPDSVWGSAVTAWVVGEPDVTAVREAVRTELGPASVPRAVHRIDVVPLLPSGKPDRRRLASGAEPGAHG